MIGPRYVLSPSGAQHVVTEDGCDLCGPGVAHDRWPESGCSAGKGHRFKKVRNHPRVEWQCLRCGMVPPVRTVRGKFYSPTRNTL